MLQNFCCLRKFFQAKTPDSATLHPGYELMRGAHPTKPLRLLRSLRLNLLSPLLFSPVAGGEKTFFVIFVPFVVNSFFGCGSTALRAAGFR
jgi:hypothetical protein